MICLGPPISAMFIWASERICQGGAGISYAFMNYSKFDNPSEESYAADKIACDVL